MVNQLMNYLKMIMVIRLAENKRYRLKYKFKTRKNEYANIPMRKCHMNYCQWCMNFGNRILPIRVRMSEKCMVMWKKRFHRKIAY